MAGKTGIAWTDATWNPIRGCSRVSEGCRNCYAERVAWRHEHRFVEVSIDSARTTTQTVDGPYHGLVKRGPTGPIWTGEVRFVQEALDLPLRWKRPRRIFVNSMSDLFHEKVPDEWIAVIYGVMAASMQHTFQVLTKRPDQRLRWWAWVAVHGGLGPFIRSQDGRDALRDFYRHGTRTEVYRGRAHRSADDAWAMVLNAAACVGKGPLPNVWEGVSVEDQATADARIPVLLQTPASVRFVSYEPALGPVDFRPWLPGFAWPEGSTRALNWLIIGGESGPHARPCDLAWIRSVVAQCKAAGTPCFVKQLGAHVMESRGERGSDGPEGVTVISGMRYRDRKGADPSEWPDDLRVQEFPK